MYVDWLNGMAGAKIYRLLSEAEWEYAARGVTSDKDPHPDYPWGNEIGKVQAPTGVLMSKRREPSRRRCVWRRGWDSFPRFPLLSTT